jgi:hypothetical protein
MSSYTQATPASLLLPSISAKACPAPIFPDLASGSLLSIGQLCDDGCTATFSATQVVIKLPNGHTVLSGHFTPTTQLWYLDVIRPTAPPR